MDWKQGIKEIDEAEWLLDKYGVLNLYCHTSEGKLVHSFISPRPHYCDRGHFQLLIDGPLGLDEQDSFPRFFFNLDEAKAHTKNFLKWRLWKYSKGLRDYPLLDPGKKVFKVIESGYAYKLDL